MKIVITVATYWPKLDGVQMVTQYQAEGLAKLGHEVIVITSKISGCPDEENYNDVKIIRVHAFNFYYWHKGSKKEYRRIVLDYLRDADALIAVCLQSFSADWLLGIIDQISCKTLLYMHGMPDFKVRCSDCSSIKNLAKVVFRNLRWIYFYKVHWNQIVKFDYVSHLMKNDNSYTYFNNHGYKYNVVLENACEDLFFEKIHGNWTKEKNLSSEYLLYVANYCDRKNQELALKAFYEAELGTMSMVFIGSRRNSYMNKLEELNESLVSKYGRKNVLILYGIERKDVALYTQNCFASILTSKNEYCPITIIEAMASAKPILTTDVGCVRYFPGVIIANTQKELVYWMELLKRDKDIAKYYGKIGFNFAAGNLKIQDKVKQLETCLLGK